MNANPAEPNVPQQPRPSVLSLAIKEKAALYAAYMPFLKNGGMFVPTTKPYKIGDEIYLILSLMDDANKYPIAGKVAWITPANASGGRTQGVGVRFPADEKTRLIKLKIEAPDPTNNANPLAWEIVVKPNQQLNYLDTNARNALKQRFE